MMKNGDFRERRPISANLNYKSEIRISKFETNPKFKCSKFKTKEIRCVGIVFVLVICILVI
jgi:hypothetical protein